MKIISNDAKRDVQPVSGEALQPEPNRDAKNGEGSQQAKEADATPPGLTPEEVEAIRQEAYQQGRAAAIAERDQIVEDSLASISDGVAKVAAQVDDTRATALSDAERLVRSTLRAVAPAVAETASGRELERAVMDAIERACPDGRVAVTMHPKAEKALGGRIKERAPKAEIAQDAKLNPRDARVEWSGAGADVEYSRILARVSEVLEGALDNAPPIPDREGNAQATANTENETENGDGN